MQHRQQSLWLKVSHYQLHLRQLIPAQPNGHRVLMLHGAIENSRIFYNEKGRGLACFLAEMGFEVYCADFAGRGQSIPAASRHFNHSQNQLITADIPALIRHLTQAGPVHLIAHSWAGVVLAAALARQPELVPLVRSVLTFGSKRCISVQSWQRRLHIDWVWNRLGPLLCKVYGYLPARQWRFGADNEPAQYLLDTIPWIRGEAFTDISDGFNYANACKHLNWPPSWHLAAVNDRLLGHPQDVLAFLAETGLDAGRFTLLGKATGYKMDYDHISMLTAATAREDHFVQLADWLGRQ
ncbi:alpha/beta fold hydrolase [Rheinheimera sp.]|uniref:alpha/beta fold hydrolase n=1 Tax=Rheinheimera sp. TaxID=1869214 RepID=UPI00307D206D